ncbi:RDD family protein [Streptomyces sp. NPDC046915]|uniref:RDD family protein n=1 Tax=Streptomyces sp. NPDC046915 TaxID=3155257 RepID=UPI0033FD5E15
MSSFPEYPSHSNWPQHPADSPQPYPAASQSYAGHLHGYAAPYQASYNAGIGAPPGLADLGARLGARVLDLVFWFVGYTATGGLWLSMWIDAGGGTTAQTLLVAWILASGTLYFPFAIWRFGSTLGKRICKVRVVHRITGRRLGFWRALGREVFWPVSCFIPVLGLLNSLWCVWDKPFQQCLHDKVADTMAVAR